MRYFSFQGNAVFDVAEIDYDEYEDEHDLRIAICERRNESQSSGNGFCHEKHEYNLDYF